IRGSARREEQRVAAGERFRVGVNTFRSSRGAADIAMPHAAPATLTRQIERTRRVRQERDARRVQQALQRLEGVARSTTNIMPAMLEAVQAYATIGEICDTLTHVFGLYRDPAGSGISGKQGSGLASAQAHSAGPPRRILVAKPGLDGHDRGAKTMALLLRDAGMEVIYTGIRNSIDAIVHTALQEDVQIIGLSTLSGA